jgi:hypothetical protein
MKKLKRQNVYLLFAFILSAFIALPGCGDGGGGEWDTPTGPTAALAPTVTAVTPLAGATSVPVNIKSITAAFSTAMEPTTLTTATFTLVCGAAAVTGGGAVTYLAAGNVATLPLPASDLPKAAECTATITTGAQNVSGAALAKNYVWTFTTALAIDTARPTVTLTDPETTTPGPTPDVPANTAITAIFDEDMAPLTITEGTTFSVTGPGVTPVAAMDPAVTYNVASRTATFRPAEELTPSTTYTATIKGTGIGAATDLANNALAGDPALPLVANDYVWTFTTTDPVAPQPVSVAPLTISPAAEAIDVCPSTTVKATFEVPSGLRMDPDTVNSANFTVTGPGPLFDPVEAATINLDLDSGTIATFTPLNPLGDTTTYTATIKGGPTGVKDLAIPTANEMTAAFTWDFTAGPATGVCQPLVNPGVLASFGIASAGGLTNSGATTINGDVVLNPNFFCNDEPVGEANDFGLCGATPPINNAGDMVITQTYPDTTTADEVRDALLVKWGNISPAQTPGATVLGCGTIGTTGGAGAGIGCDANSTLPPGAYISASNSTIVVDGVLTLDGQGNPDAVFIFQAPSALTMAVTSQIVLMGNAKASNVWWYVGSDATMNGGSIFNGNVLASGAISMGNLATSCGRLLSGAEGSGAFTFLANTVSVPGHSFAPVGCE